jgi:hypothetical protein
MQGAQLCPQRRQRHNNKKSQSPWRPIAKSTYRAPPSARGSCWGTPLGPRTDIQHRSSHGEIPSTGSDRCQGEEYVVSWNTSESPDRHPGAGAGQHPQVGGHRAHFRLVTQRAATVAARWKCDQGSVPHVAPLCPIGWGTTHRGDPRRPFCTFFGRAAVRILLAVAQNHAARPECREGARQDRCTS